MLIRDMLSKGLPDPPTWIDWTQFFCFYFRNTIITIFVRMKQNQNKNNKIKWFPASRNTSYNLKTNLVDRNTFQYLCITLSIDLRGQLWKKGSHNLPCLGGKATFSPTFPQHYVDPRHVVGIKPCLTRQHQLIGQRMIMIKVRPSTFYWTIYVMAHFRFRR